MEPEVIHVPELAKMLGRSESSIRSALQAGAYWLPPFFKQGIRICNPLASPYFIEPIRSSTCIHWHFVKHAVYSYSGIWGIQCPRIVPPSPGVLPTEHNPYFETLLTYAWHARSAISP